MKFNLLRFLAIGAVALVFGSAVYGQSVNVRAQVPFAFMVGDKAYPAGEYAVQTATNYSYLMTVTGRNTDKAGQSLSHPVTSGKPAEHTVLVFQRMGNIYFLSELWAEGSRLGMEFPMSRTEVRMAKNGTKTETVVVAANVVP